jgi:hypothetical protein
VVARREPSAAWENVRLTVEWFDRRYPCRVSKAAIETSDQGFVERVKTSPRLQRRLFIGALAIFALGAVALTVVLFGNTATNRETAISSEDAQVLTPQKTVPVSEEAKAVATRWILGAVNRTDLEGTYDLTHPDIRGTMTRAQWATGEIPVIPYPVDKVYDGRWRVDYSYEDEALLEIGLIPAENASERALTFYIGLKKVGEGESARWVVNYWSPRYRPPVPLAQ